MGIPGRSAPVRTTLARQGGAHNAYRCGERLASHILGLGSANLTRSGWEENDELFSFRTCPDWCVPKVLKDELLDSDWLRSSEFAVWCDENEVAPKSSSGGVRLLTNVSGTPIWEQLFGPYRSGGWDEAHIIAPFTERAVFSDPEPGGRTKQFFKEMADTKASGKSVLHVYLAPSDLSASSSNRVVAESSPFDWLDDQPLKLRMHIDRKSTRLNSSH